MKLYDLLFETEALKISPADKPFFYTSGKLGPFYINTHYLFGGAFCAVSLLNQIDEMLCADKSKLPFELLEKTYEMYRSNKTYKMVIDSLISLIERTKPISGVEYICGGERRDWFFSFPISRILNKKHITIYKDMSLVATSNGKSEQSIDNVSPNAFIHIADLVTEASSFANTWVPALKKEGIRSDTVYSIVDRDQGGADYFTKINSKFYSLIKIDIDFFRYAYKNSYIDQKQLDVISQYIKSPDECMREFLLENKDFLVNSLNGDEKTIKKAALLIKNNLYDLPEGFLDVSYV